VEEVMRVDEEVVLLEEQLAAAHSDIERLEARLAESEAKATSREADAAELRRQLSALEGSLAERDAAIATHTARLVETEALLEQKRDASRSDAARYRDLILRHEPELPADLVAGDTIDAVELSLVQARQTVAQVRQHLEQQAQALRVPAGAPVRAAPDLSSLSSAEKIRLGLQQS
jgi:hypothetical protein